MIFTHCQAVIFDCDGVLVDSEYLCHVALSAALQDLGIDEPAQALYTEFGGVELARIFVAMERRHRVDLPAGFEARYRAGVQALFAERLQPVSGIESVLRQLTLPFCVASNGPRAKIEYSLGLTCLRGYFGERIYSAYEVGAWKPDPGLFLAAAGGLGVAPQHCLVVEDSPVGVRAARAAGMPVLRYCPDAGSDAGDVPTIQRMAQLPALLGLPRR
ncbi:HAD-IA family hydrolase [Parahaliea mediterranea]|uniref:HAD-IA family hydrolase n=1 Tax=Parahaliea mediterranea TaxID=651086 RepID=UPI0019D48966|nr:HAD-IA family hydrolase [Parahaliea mediterranea]